MIFYGLAKKRYETEEQEMNRGGEGFILRILDDAGIVAKLFLPARRTSFRRIFSIIRLRRMTVSVQAKRSVVSR